MKRTTIIGFLLAGFFVSLTNDADTGKTIVYTLYADTNSLSSVKLGTETLTGQIELRFKSDTKHARLTYENNNTLPVYRNDTGSATIAVKQGRRTVVADIFPNQIYVRYDPTNGVIGFGSYSSGIYYPMSMSCHLNPCGDVQSIIGNIGAWSIIGAMSDVFNNTNDAANYSLPQTATDLQGPALITGRVSYCQNSTSNCVSPAAAIKTNLGDLYLYPLSAANVGGGVFTAELVTDDD